MARNFSLQSDIQATIDERSAERAGDDLASTLEESIGDLTPGVDGAGAGGVEGLGGARANAGGGGGVGGSAARGGLLAGLGGAASGGSAAGAAAKAFPVVLAGATAFKIAQGIQRLVTAAPAFSQTASLFGEAARVFFRPFGNFLGELLRPMATNLLDFAIGFNDTWGPALSNMADDINTMVDDVADLLRVIGGGEGSTSVVEGGTRDQMNGEGVDWGSIIPDVDWEELITSVDWTQYVATMGVGVWRDKVQPVDLDSKDLIDQMASIRAQDTILEQARMTPNSVVSGRVDMRARDVVRDQATIDSTDVIVEPLDLNFEDLFGTSGGGTDTGQTPSGGQDDECPPGMVWNGIECVPVSDSTGGGDPPPANPNEPDPLSPGETISISPEGTARTMNLPEWMSNLQAVRNAASGGPQGVTGELEGAPDLLSRDEIAEVAESNERVAQELRRLREDPTPGTRFTNEDAQQIITELQRLRQVFQENNWEPFE